MKLLRELMDVANNGGYTWDPTPLQIEETLIKHCAPFLRAVDGGVNQHQQLWRGGDEGGKKKFDRIEARTGARNPKDTPQNVHDYLNKWFKEKFGWSARDALFCSGRQGVASQYGDIKAIFPIGRFSYIWSPDIQDMYSDLHLKHYGYDDEDEFSWDMLDKRLDKTNWKTDGLDEALKGMSEIMINCDAYFILAKDLVDEIDWHYVYEAI